MMQLWWEEFDWTYLSRRLVFGELEKQVLWVTHMLLASIVRW